MTRLWTAVDRDGRMLDFTGRPCGGDEPGEVFSNPRAAEAFLRDLQTFATWLDLEGARVASLRCELEREPGPPVDRHCDDPLCTQSDCVYRPTGDGREVTP